jgi:glutamyl-tRNA reductase
MLARNTLLRYTVRMNIRMAGVDYTKAGVGERERFAFTAAASSAALNRIRERYAGCGCVIIATCNRTEFWLSAENGDCPPPDRLLCELKNVPLAENSGFIVNRAGFEAVEHLFFLASGLKSQITGENQILSQIKEAVETAQKAGSALTVLQRLFQSAISCAKRVRTETGLARADVSAASAALDFLREGGIDVQGAECLVIGSGVVGRLCAGLFERAGANVTMTLRQHKTGKTLVGKNIRLIDYDGRYARLPDYRLVISATVSPHHTIAYPETVKVLDGREIIFLDLAVPRDIDPDIKKIAGVSLFDIDEITGRAQGSRVDVDDAKRIISEETAAFAEWYKFRAHIETVKAIRNEAAADIARRAGRAIKDTAIDEIAETYLTHAVTEAAGKVMDKMLYGLRDNLDSAFWADCLAALHGSVTVGAGADERARA